ncbi:MAG TPA: hypothetical protein VMV10_08135 [Pirellulales bacterium]|nr:hypothetical protein [Pirellulales bacterium]
MMLVINKPDPVLPGVDTLTVYTTNGLDIWQTPNKVPFLNNPPQGNPDQGEMWEIPIASLPMTAYIEVVRQSQALKDMYVKAQYGDFADQIPITGIWVSPGGVSAGQTQDELLQSFPDLDPALQNYFPRGTGVLPTSLTPNYYAGTTNAISFQWHVMPLRGPNDGTWENDNIFFDATRQMALRVWYKPTPDGVWTMAPQAWNNSSGTWYKDWPVKVEYANDDPPYDIDSSKQVTAQGNIYSADEPTVQLDNSANWNELQYKLNAREFVRVEIDAGSRVSGNGWNYSRGSDYVQWHSEIWCVPDALDATMWARRTGDNLHNEIGTGDYIDLGQPTE